MLRGMADVEQNPGFHGHNSPFGIGKFWRGLFTFLESRLNSREPHSHQILVQLSGSCMLPAATSHNPRLPECLLKNRSKYLSVGLPGRIRVSRQGDSASSSWQPFCPK